MMLPYAVWVVGLYNTIPPFLTKPEETVRSEEEKKQCIWRPWMANLHKKGEFTLGS